MQMLGRSFARKTALILVAAFVALQWIPAGGLERPAPPAARRRSLWQDPAVPPGVAAVLKRSCGDCHSSETRWPWYSRVAPVSWFVQGHVRAGRRALNLSAWAVTEPDGKVRRDPGTAAEICGVIEQGVMPLPSYALLHRDAALSPAEVLNVCQWSSAMLRAGASARR